MRMSRLNMSCKNIILVAIIVNTVIKMQSMFRRLDWNSWSCRRLMVHISDTFMNE